MITKEQIEKIKNFAIDLDWNKAFDGASKGNRHLFRIVNKAKESTKNYDVDASIVESGAWLHDSGLAKTANGNTLANKEKVLKHLEEFGVSKEDQMKILHCIESHDGRVIAKTIEAKIVHDADTLEKMGPLGIIRETWKKARSGWTTEKIVEHLKTHIKKRENRLYTKEAKERAGQLNEELNLENFLKVVDKQLKEKCFFF